MCALKFNFTENESSQQINKFVDNKTVRKQARSDAQIGQLLEPKETFANTLFI